MGLKPTESYRRKLPGLVILSMDLEDLTGDFNIKGLNIQDRTDWDTGKEEARVSLNVIQVEGGREGDLIFNDLHGFLGTNERSRLIDDTGE